MRSRRSRQLLEKAQTNRALELRSHLNTPGRYLVRGQEDTLFLSAQAADAIRDWLRQEYRLGWTAARRGR